MSWPSESEYKEVVRDNFKDSVLDLRLKEGKPKISDSRADVISDCGEFAIVFPIDVSSKTFALRCRTEDDRDIYEARYEKVSDYLKKVGLPYFVEFTYVREGILVNGKKLPIIRMEWVEGKTLRQFVEENLETPHILKIAAAEFQKMVTTLHAHQISHGDFQDGNILLKCDGDDVKIKLIDYDSLCVPGLYSTPQTTDGLSEYQHPQRMTDGWDANEKIDYFSELVIYLSFLSIAEKPELWNQFKDSTEYGLLFAEEDFENPTESEVFRALENLSPEVKQLTSVLKDFCAKTSVNQLASLESLLQSESTYYDSGLEHLNRAEYEEAITDFKSALTHSPNYKETYYQLGCAYFEKGEYAEAINSLSETRAIDPTFTSAYYKLADTYLEIGEYVEMESSLEGARFIAPEEKIPYKTACYKLADAYLKANQPDEAVRVLQKVIEVESMDKTAHHKLADVYLEMNKFDNAVSSLEKAITTDPDDLAVHRKLADTYMKQNHYDEAAVILKKIVEEIKPDDKIVYYELACAYRGKCDYDKAVIVLKKVVNEIDDSDKTAHEKLADTYNEAGKHTEAIRSYQQAIAIDNTDKTTHEKLGDVYSTIDKYAEAVRSYQQAIAIDNTDETTHEKLGDAYLGMYNSVTGAFDWAKDRAIDSYREVIELDSANKGVGNKIAALQNQEGQNVIESDAEGDALDEPEKVASDVEKTSREQPDWEIPAFLRVNRKKHASPDDATLKKYQPEGDALDEPEEVASKKEEVLAGIDRLTDVLRRTDLEISTSPVLDSKDSTSSDSDALKKHQKAEKLSEKPAPPENMELIPAGDFSMGGGYHSEENPKHTVYVDEFYIDIHEVTNAQYKEFVDANPEWQEEHIEAQFHDGSYLQHWYWNNYSSDEGNHPVVYVSWYAAMAYAEWVGKRLPTEAEWEKAARGGQSGTKYPWGHSSDSSKANYDYYQGSRNTTPVGSYPANGYGLYDMIGNVCEWCLDEFQQDFYNKSPRQNPIAGAESIVDAINNFTKIRKRRVLRGGHYGTFHPTRVRVTSRYRYRPEYTSRDIGFRCVSVSDPSDATGSLRLIRAWLNSEFTDLLRDKNATLEETKELVAAVHNDLLSIGAITTEERTAVLVLTSVQENHNRGCQIFYDMFKHELGKSSTNDIYDEWIPLIHLKFLNGIVALRKAELGNALS